MKALWLTRNRRGRRGAPRISLFPFLAVLICSMGALVLLLLSVTRQARLQASREASAKNAEQQSNIATEMEMVQWRVDQLQASRKETEAQLAEARLLLGHLEDHERRLRDQLRELSRQAKKAAEEGLKADRFVTAGEDELRQIERQIAAAQLQLDQARQAVAKRAKSYAIVPYDGLSRTRRRPIYIECRGDAVVMQPENIIFTEADFDEPLGPGNPLAAAIRAACEQMRLQRSVDPQNQGEPYPLLLVRPAGIAAYDAALAAMKSWGSEFGYELISEDWQLDYPPSDPNLAKAVTQARDMARQEHDRLIAAAPRMYGKRPRSGAYRSDTGVDGGGHGGAGEDGSPGFYSSKPSERYAGNNGGGSAVGSGSGQFGGHGGGGGPGHAGGIGSAEGSGSGGGTGSAGGDGSGSSADAEFTANNPYASLTAAGVAGSPGMLPSGPGNGSGYGVGGAPGYGGGGALGPANVLPGGTGNGPGSGTGNPGGLAMGGAAGNGAGGGAPGSANMLPGGSSNGSGNPGGLTMGGSPGNGGSGGVPDSANNNPGGNGSVACNVAAGANGSLGTSQSGSSNNYPPAGGPGAMQVNGQPADGSLAAARVVRPDGYITGRPNDGNPPPVQSPPPSTSVAMVPQAPLLPGEWRPTEEPPKRDPAEEQKEKEEKKKHPYDKVAIDHDQDDWALRKSTRHAAAISRPIHVDCYPDRLVLLSDTAGEPRVIFCDSSERRNADKLVAAVWEIMDTWGMAGREMYWHPILNFYVVPGAEPRMLGLARALDGSGLVIERKQ